MPALFALILMLLIVPTGAIADPAKPHVPLSAGDALGRAIFEANQMRARDARREQLRRNEAREAELAEVSAPKRRTVDPEAWLRRWHPENAN